MNGFALRAYAGEIIGLLGRNGCGKSSLLQIIFGSLSPQYSHIRIDDTPQKKAYKKNLVSYLPQKNFIPGFLNAQRAGDLYQIKDFNRICAQFKIDDKTPLSEFSGGQRRMVETLLILNSPAPVILLDEPFSHISPLQIEMLIPLIKSMAKNRVTIITDHLYRYLIQVSDKIMLMHNGSHYPIKDQNDLKQFGYLAE